MCYLLIRNYQYLIVNVYLSRRRRKKRINGREGGKQKGNEKERIRNLKLCQTHPDMPGIQWCPHGRIIVKLWMLILRAIERAL